MDVPIAAHAAIAAYAVVVVGSVILHSGGYISLLQAITALCAPALFIGAAFRPAWVLLLLVGTPPGLLATLTPGILLVLAAGTLLAQTVVRGTVRLGYRSGLFPLIILTAAAFVFRADEGGAAGVQANGFLRYFAYYALISVISYNAVRLGDLRRGQLVNALLIGMVGAAIIKVVQTGFGPIPHASGGGRADPLSYGRNFAYLAVVGFSIAFARWLIRRREGDGSGFDLLLATFFLLLVATSLVRGAWISALLVLLILSWYSGRRSYWLLVPLLLIIVLSVPAARERVAPSQDRVDITTGRWGLWTVLLEDHIFPSLPAGNGFGYAWSLTPDEVFGHRTFLFSGVSDERFLYPHNDFLFWAIEFGLWGLALWIVYWIHLVAVTRNLLRGADYSARSDALVCVGILVTMFVTQMVANGYALQPLSERFFITAGFLFGSRAVTSPSAR